MRPPGLARGVLLAAVGGALGGLARHGLDVLYGATTFPWSTFTINVLGATVLALLPAIPAVERRPNLAVLLGAGFLGGFTTLSAFSEQTRLLVDTGHQALAATYVVGSLGAALVAVLVVRRLTTPGERDAFRDEGGDA
ncbi:MAG: hypothetical protein JWO46_1938 [Nocardioidaceae bacterium]|nr:hypothetical protein [Nocardioidaceae bacterium]